MCLMHVTLVTIVKRIRLNMIKAYIIITYCNKTTVIWVGYSYRYTIV